VQCKLIDKIWEWVNSKYIIIKCTFFKFKDVFCKHMVVIVRRKSGLFPSTLMERLLWFYRVIRKQMITIGMNPRVFRKLTIQLNNQNKRSKWRRPSLPANRHSLKLKRLLLLLKNYINQIIYNKLYTQVSVFKLQNDLILFWLSSKFFSHIIAISSDLDICRYFIFLYYFCNITFNVMSFVLFTS